MEHNALKISTTFLRIRGHKPLAVKKSEWRAQAREKNLCHIAGSSVESGKIVRAVTLELSGPVSNDKTIKHFHRPGKKRKVHTDSTNAMRRINHLVDFNRTTQYTRLLLMMLGVWPMVEKHPKKLNVWLSKFVIAFCSLLMALIFVPSSLHLFREKNPMIKLMLFGPVSFCLSSILKYCSILLRAEMIKNCLHHVEEDWTLIKDHKDREIMMKNADVGRGLTLLCGIFLYTGGLSYHTIMPLFRGNSRDSENRTIRPLVYPGYDVFFDPQLSPNYEFVFYSNCISACVTYTITTTACNLAAIFVTHACGQIEIMSERLRNVFDSITDDASEIVQKRVGSIVKLHVRVLRLASMIEALLREICLIEVVSSTFIICLLEYYCMTEWNNSEIIAILTYFVLLISLTFNIFIFCHIGELLKAECSRVGEATYLMDWYRLPGRTGLALIMMISMSHYPRKLTAGRMMELSVTSFGAIIKTSVMYLNMLRTVTV